MKCEFNNFAQEEIIIKGKIIKDKGVQFYEKEKDTVVKGGRNEAYEILKTLDNTLKNYDTDRNLPIKKTSRLSAYNKFGCISIRELYYATRSKLKDKAEPFIRQLYWRDFYYFIGEFYPHIFEGPMKVNYAGIQWRDDDEVLERWKEGRTGCPIVDASMRDLNKTGYMPNRCRMIVANYLVKDLHINWQEGEKYFASKLVDYDPCQNNGGWQWSAGCGVDSQPYFRIFNPESQSQKVDKDCKYIKKWIPELKEVENKDIHSWEEACMKKAYKDVKYPRPLVKHKNEKEICIQMYVKALEKAKKEGIDTNSYKDEKLLKKALERSKSYKREKKSEEEVGEGKKIKKKSKGIKEFFKSKDD